jgi:hypothetical protein
MHPEKLALCVLALMDVAGIAALIITVNLLNRVADGREAFVLGIGFGWILFKLLTDAAHFLEQVFLGKEKE